MHKRVADAEAFGFFASAGAQEAQDQFHEAGRADVLRESRVGWARNGDELATRFQDAQGFFQRLAVLAVQGYVVALQDAFEVIFPVVDDNIGTEALHPVDVGGAGGGGYSGPEMLRQLNGKGARGDPTGKPMSATSGHWVSFTDRRQVADGRCPMVAARTAALRRAFEAAD